MQPVHQNDLNIPVPLYKTDNFNGYYTTSKDTTLRIKPFDLDIVPPSSGVQFYRNGILFLSYNKTIEKMPEKHISFGAIRPYMALISDTVAEQYMPFITSSSVLFPSEATTFSMDYNTMYLSILEKGGNKEKIYRAGYGQDGWVIDNEPLDFCKDNYIYSHPALSKDGTFMIFSSDLPGNTGGLDLYITRWENDKWSDPVNLGKQINSSGTELFASLDSENNLYFSSDGLSGLGGYDIFMCKYNGENWSLPENLTSLFNSQNDEVAFSINPADSKSAFFTSRANSAKNNAQLYMVTTYTESLSDFSSNITSTLLAVTGLINKAQPAATAILAVKTTDNPESRPEPAQKNTAEKVVITQSQPQAKAQTQTEKQPQTKPAETKPETAKPISSSEVKNDIVVYRVQILANTKPVGNYNLTIDDKGYMTYEYLYMGGYRTCVGEFSTPGEAIRFQSICRQSGYNQAFVVAFKNNVRSNDPELFKR